MMNINNVEDMPNTTYNAQPYFTDQSNSPPSAQTIASDNFPKAENVKLTRPVPAMNASETQEYKGTVL